MPAVLHVGPVKLLTPVVAWPVAIAHAGVTAVELKLPLDWAKTRPDPSVATANTAVNLFITCYILPFSLVRLNALATTNG